MEDFLLVITILLRQQDLKKRAKKQHRDSPNGNITHSIMSKEFCQVQSGGLA